MGSFYVFLLLVLPSVLTAKVYEGSCDENRCKNGGTCVEAASIPPTYQCVCTSDFVGDFCHISAPVISCGKQAIEIEINSAIIDEMNLSSDEKLIHFSKSPNCRAVKRENLFHLRIDAPFVDCGLSLEMDDENFVFSQKVIYHPNSGKLIERPVVLVDFKCSYSGRYQVSFDPIKPTVTTVDFDTTYGEFTLQMDLFKTQKFEQKLSLRPVIAVNEEVCIKNNIVGELPEELVLSTLKCWGSDEELGDGNNYNLIENRCLADESNSVLLNNGDSNDVKFCFNVFKWKESMTSVYIHCKVQVCNNTANDCACSNSIARVKRDVEENSLENIASINSQRILIVNNRIYDDWLNLLESEQEFMDEYNDVSETNDETQGEKKSGLDRRTVLLIVGVILVVVIICLGILVGVVVSYTKKSKAKKVISSISSSDI